MLNDGVNSLARYEVLKPIQTMSLNSRYRMYSSTFSDWFSQAVIDFMLGNRSLNVFSEFLFRLQSTDPRELLRISKIRAEAVSTSVARVLPEGESLLNSGWTFAAPEDLNETTTDRFEEKILLLVSRQYFLFLQD